MIRAAFLRRAPAEPEQFVRALRRRQRGAGVRTLQGLLIGALTWAATREPLIAVWLVAVLATGFVEARVSRAALAQAEPWTRRTSVSLLQALSSAVFSLIAAVLIVSSATPIRLAEAGFALCAVALNNAIMASGSRYATAALTGPPAGLLILAPFWVGFTGDGLTLVDTVMLSIGGGAYIAFIIQLSAAMAAEREAVIHSAREAEAGNDRWRMVFHNSPMARICFDASAVHERLQATLADGHVSLGVALHAAYRDGVALSRDTRILEANGEARSLLPRYGAARAFGPEYFTAFAMALDGMDADGAVPPFDAPMILDDGERRIIRIHYRLTAGEGAPWSLCLGAFEDVTETRRTAQAQEDARRAAEEANRAKSDFLTVMSHEIRTPLNGVLGMAQAMEHGPLNGAQRDRLKVIRESGAALAGLLDDLLDISRLGDSPPAGAESQEAGAAPEPHAPPGRISDGALRVLAAEDNEVNRMVLKALLAQFDLVPTLVENGEEAVRAWEAAHWDVILMDVQMPVMDGPTAAMTIRAREAVLHRPRTPILAVTANTMPHQVASYRAAGMDDVVAKPLNVAELFAALVAAIEAEEPAQSRIAF